MPGPLDSRTGYWYAITAWSKSQAVLISALGDVQEYCYNISWKMVPAYDGINFTVTQGDTLLSRARLKSPWLAGTEAYYTICCTPMLNVHWLKIRISPAVSAWRVPVWENLSPPSAIYSTANTFCIGGGEHIPCGYGGMPILAVCRPFNHWMLQYKALKTWIKCRSSVHLPLVFSLYNQGQFHGHFFNGQC